MEHIINENFKIINDDSREMLKYLKENSIDSIVCDPPYELGFMNKKWDSTGIAYDKEFWEQCFKVLKPGGYLLAFGGSRTFHRIACAIEDAGFEIRDTIMWLYGSGFPKSQNVGLMIDKKDTKEFREKIGKLIKEHRIKKGYSMDELCELIGLNNEGHGGMVNHYENGRATPTIELFKKICNVLDIENEEQKYINDKLNRLEKVGEKITNTTVYQNIGDKNISGIVDVNKPKSEIGNQWSGYGTCLKPAFEPIIMARKPVEKTIVDNVLKYGVGALNIDECRVGTEKMGGGTMQDFKDVGEKQKEISGVYKMSFGQVENSKRKENPNVAIGRFPANVITDGSEEVAMGMPYTKSEGGCKRQNSESMFGMKQMKDDFNFHDEGSAMRYFYCAKASKKDRDEGLDNFEEIKVNDGREKDIDNAFQRGTTLRKNIHPSVKPTELMQYLVRLVSPKGATILDPFNGSGSTGKAVAFENRERNANYKYIGFELEKEYVDISIARIKYALNQYEYEEKKEEEMPETGQMRLF